VLFSNIVARAKGSSLILGHLESPLDGISFENLKLTMGTDPSAAFEQAEHAMLFRNVKNLRLRNVEISWGIPVWESWKSALYLENVLGLEVDRFRGRGAFPVVPAVVLENVSSAGIRDSAPEGTNFVFQVIGANSRDIRFEHDAVLGTTIPYQIDRAVAPGAVLIDEGPLRTNATPR